MCLSVCPTPQDVPTWAGRGQKPFPRAAGRLPLCPGGQEGGTQGEHRLCQPHNPALGIPCQLQLQLPAWSLFICPVPLEHALPGRRRCLIRVHPMTQRKERTQEAESSSQFIPGGLPLHLLILPGLFPGKEWLGTEQGMFPPGLRAWQRTEDEFGKPQNQPVTERSAPHGADSPAGEAGEGARQPVSSF